MKRVFSSVVPGATVTLDTFFNSLAGLGDGQHDIDRMVMIADLQALGLGRDPNLLKNATLELAALAIGAGVDPSVSTLFIQSQVPQETQLSWIFETVAGVTELGKLTKFAEIQQAADGLQVSSLTSPCLQAASALLYRADVVAIDEEMRAFIETLVERACNGALPVPQTVQSHTPIYNLQTPAQRMNRNTDESGVIAVLAEPSIIEKAILDAVTEPDSEIDFDPPSRPGISNLINILSLSTGRTTDAVAAEHSDVESLKSEVADAVIEMLTPVHDGYFEALDDLASLQGMLAAGAEHAQEIAANTLRRVHEARGLVVTAL